MLNNSETTVFSRTARYSARSLILGVLLWAPLPASVAQTADDGNLIVTLLGTGTPALKPHRYGAANLVQAGGLNLLIDAGRGASIRLNQAGVTPGEVDAVFLTHFHSDHVNGLADIFLVGYITASTLHARRGPFVLHGPKGTQRLAEGIRLAHQWDIDTRITDEKVAEVATRIHVREHESGVVFDQHGVRVTMFPVLHGKNITPSVGYRVDYKGKSVVFSGDTTYDENVIKFGRGADVLVHELGMATSAMRSRPEIQRILAHHTTPEQAGQVFQQARPKLAVYSHMVLLGSPPLSRVIERTRQTYQGPLILGEDLMQFVIGDDEVTVLSATQ